MPALIFPILWLAAAGGAQINEWLHAVPGNALPLERRLFGIATGLLLLAYCVLLVGLLGALSAIPVLLCAAGIGVIGWKQHARIAQDIGAGFSSIKFTTVGIVSALLFLIFAATALLGDFTPPSSLEYDSLTYHLADPKIYLTHHRIIYLPWESHSNFAFTMEMLYTIGLSLHSIPLAKLFHFTMGLVSVAATYLIGKRVHSALTGLAASLLFASLPLVFWEAGTAYVDLAAVAFGALSLLALIAWLVDQNPDPAWSRVSVIMLAAMVSVKATSLVNVFLFAAAVVIVLYLRSKNPLKSIYAGGAFAILSVAAGSVWYVKAWIVTGNPFFPFAYSIFGGKHWSAVDAVMYARSQAEFGAGHKLIDLLLAPWNLVFFLLQRSGLPNGVTKPFNDYQTDFSSLSAVLPAAMFVPAFRQLKTPPAVKALGLYGLVSFLVWFLLTQQVRYLLPTLPVYCVLAAFVVVELMQGKGFAKFALAGLCSLSLLFSSFVAFNLVSQELPRALGGAPPGWPYPAMQFLNEATPKDSGVVFYGEPRDFYCDRNYMWGEPGHGIVIPYQSMNGPGDLRNWLLLHGFEYLYIDSSQAAITPGPGMNGLVYDLTAGSGSLPIYQAGPVDIYQVR